MRQLAYAMILSLFFAAPVYGDLLDVDDLDSQKNEPKPEPEKEEKPTAPANKEDSQAPKKAPPPAKPAEKKPAKKSAKNAPREPIRLKSEGRSTYSRDGGIIHLVKNVVITQGQLRFQANEAKVYLNQNHQSQEEQDNVDRVEVIGDVQIAKFSEDPNEKITAKGDRAFFYNEKRKVVLIGNARFWRGGHLVKGKQISYDLDTGMITVDRAEGVVKPGEGKNDKPK